MDPHYKIIAVALKYVLSGKITVSHNAILLIIGRGCDAVHPVYVVLSSDDGYFVCRPQYVPGSRFDKFPKHQKRRQETLASSTDLQSISRMNILTQIAHLLEVARWDPAGAKLEMDNIVGGATKVKALVSIWRPEFERYLYK